MKAVTAYDLNKGTIKWQVPAGDDLAMAAQGVHDTGSRQLRTGIIPTATGLVFQVGGDRKLRAYDEETGKVLWTKEIGGSSRGVPAMYEVNGREYLVIAVSAGGGRGGGATPAPNSFSTGYLAFALPVEEKSPAKPKKELKPYGLLVAAREKATLAGQRGTTPPMVGGS